MKISILLSSDSHPVTKFIKLWIKKNSNNHDISLYHSSDQLSGGDILFLISCNEIIGRDVRALFSKTLVLHASDLPKGRGWSPHIWDIIFDADHITITLLEAVDSLDAGDIWRKLKIPVPKHYLWYEINELLFKAELELMDFAINHFTDITPEPQVPGGETYLPKRSPKDSEINPFDTIANQFNLIRISDPERFPSRFKLHGHQYKLILEKIEE